MRARSPVRPLPLRLEAIGALHQRRQRNRVEPSAKFNTCGERRLRQFLRCIGLQKTLEEMILQYLIRQHGPAVEALPVGRGARVPRTGSPAAGQIPLD